MATKNGQIPGKTYGIGGWATSQLQAWLTQNMHKLLPQSIQTSDAQLETITVGTSLTLSPAAVTDLKKQLGL